LTTASGRPADFQIELLDSYGLSAAFNALITDERELYLAADDATFVPYQQWNRQVHRRWETLFDRAIDWLGLVEKEATRRGFATTTFERNEMRNRGLATLICESAEHATALREWVAPQLDADLLCNQNVRLVQIVDARTGKGPLLSLLAWLRNHDSTRVLAVGDSVNDLSMLDGSHGFHPATVANASAEIRDLVSSAGGYVASRPNGHGVDEILHRLLAEQRHEH
jgi:hydroxymethylpyrimidine pyrophosphatase-like HAD family hydrolase